MQNKPKVIGETLKSLLQHMGIEQKINRYQVLDLWPELVGEQIADIANAERVRDKILYVKVKSMTWRTELLFQKPHILKKIENKFGKNIITDIRFY